LIENLNKHGEAYVKEIDFVNCNVTRS